jgi:aquaporin Z
MYTSTKKKLWQELAAEFLGTYMLVFTVALVSLQADNDKALKAFGGFAIACVLMVMIYSLAAISGAHLNPAVTFAVFLQRRPIKGAEAGKEEETFDMKMAGQFVFIQCIAGALAGLSAGLMYGFGGAQVGPQGDVGNALAFAVGAPAVEFWYTLMLCFVVLNVAPVSKFNENAKNNQCYGLAIGFVVLAGAYAAGPVSGACFNPAVTLGQLMMGPNWTCFFVPIYIGAQFAAAFFSVTALHIVRPETKQKLAEDANAVVKFAHRVEGMFDAEDTSEFIGTFFLCLTISLNFMAQYGHEKGKLVLHGKGGNPGGVWSIAAAYMTMIYALGDVSGAVFNPALTLAYALRYFRTNEGLGSPNTLEGKLCDPTVHPKETTKYMLAQFIGGAAGAGVTFLIYMTTGVIPAASIEPQNLPNDQKGTFTIWQAFFAEIIGTFLLCYVVIIVMSAKKKLKDYAPFAIGACIVAGGYGCGPLSGGILNPAVVVANSLLHEVQIITSLAPLLFVIAEVLGGVLAAAAFRYWNYSHEFTGESMAAPLMSVPSGETSA